MTGALLLLALGAIAKQYLRSKYAHSPDFQRTMSDFNAASKNIDLHAHSVNKMLDKEFMRIIKKLGYWEHMAEYRPFPYWQPKRKPGSRKSLQPSLETSFVDGEMRDIHLTGDIDHTDSPFHIKEPGLDATFTALHEFGHFLNEAILYKQFPQLAANKGRLRWRDLAERDLRAESICDLFAMNVMRAHYKPEVARAVETSLIDARQTYATLHDDHIHNTSYVLRRNGYRPKPGDSLIEMYIQAVNQYLSLPRNWEVERTIELAAEQMVIERARRSPFALAGAVWSGQSLKA